MKIILLICCISLIVYSCTKPKKEKNNSQLNFAVTINVETNYCDGGAPYTAAEATKLMDFYNLVNPIISLCFPFEIFPFLIIGHRHSLPQHKIMGEIDDKLLRIMNYMNMLNSY